jgi:hypothetical protein
MPALSLTWLSLLQNSCAHPWLDCMLKLLNGTCWSNFQREHTVNVRLNSRATIAPGTSTEITNNDPGYSLNYDNLPYRYLDLVVFIHGILPHLLPLQPPNDVRTSREEARGSVMVEALGYKPENRGFVTRWNELIFLNLPNPSSRTRPWSLLSP